MDVRQESPQECSQDSPDESRARHGTPLVAVLGQGEAGAEITRDLVAAGVRVRVFDPVADAVPGAFACGDEAEAVRGAGVVLSVNSATAAADALRSGLDGVRQPEATVWADLNTASPALEVRLARTAAERGLLFADVSLMSPVPARGLRTPMLVSGTGASVFARALTPLGADIETLDLPAGEASRRKLLRSVFFKGMAAAVTEALAAARRADLEDWMRELIAGELEHADTAFADRLERGSVTHAVRRREEMQAAAELLTSLGVPPRVAVASRDWLDDLAREKLQR